MEPLKLLLVTDSAKAQAAAATAKGLDTLSLAQTNGHAEIANLLEPFSTPAH
jgi:hypothetical protein